VDVLNTATALAHTLRERGWRLVTAESCTGGLVSAACTELSGSSEWLDRGFVTYSNAAKTEMLGVPAAMIEAHGAVSELVARAMAEGALRHSAAQVALSITGVAGPLGGSIEKPVGTVCFAWATPLGVFSERLLLSGDRAAVRHAAVQHALLGLLQRL
jgi:nicotinamide-nucleotide amidase